MPPAFTTKSVIRISISAYSPVVPPFIRIGSTTPLASNAVRAGRFCHGSHFTLPAFLLAPGGVNKRASRDAARRRGTTAMTHFCTGVDQISPTPNICGLAREIPEGLERCAWFAKPHATAISMSGSRGASICF